MCYPNSVGFIEFLMDFSIYDDMLHNTDKKLLHLKLSKSGQFLLIEKTGFPSPSHKFGLHLASHLSAQLEHV